MAIEQQTFLRDAMRRLDLTRNDFANRITVSRRALDSWMQPQNSEEYQSMPEIVYSFVSEILSSSTQNNNSTTPLREKIKFEGRHQLISVDQFTRESAEEFLRIADIMQPIARRQKTCRVLEGAVLGNLFFEASTRTRISFGTAFCRLGGSVIDTTGFTFSSMAKGESIYDTSRVMGGYVDAMAIRHPDKGSVAEFSRAVNIPVVNAGDGAGEHPSQSLLDLYTIDREFSRLDKRLDGAHIVFTGDLKYGRTVHSLGKLLSLYKGLKFTLIAPPTLEMPQYIIEHMSKNGHTVEQTTNLVEGIKGADVIYATRIQKERLEGENIDHFLPNFQVNSAAVNASCGKDTLIMHPLPRDAREGAFDLSTDLNLDPRLAIFRQTDNGIPVRMAIFAYLLGVENQIQRNLRDVTWTRPSHYGVDDPIFDLI